MRWAFMTANYVSRELQYGSDDWGKCHNATVDAFHGDRFSEKFEELLVTIKNIGFDDIELWIAHLEPLKATPEMIATANALLKKHNMGIVSYTAGFGRPGVSREEATAIFETAKAIGTPVLAQGFHPANGPLVKELAEKYNIRMGHENHPEKTPQEVIQKVADFAPWVGSAIDTGWFATQGYDAVKAVYELKDHLVHVHLKDIIDVGSHHSCVLGDGIANIKGILKAIKDIGYTGPITIEHEPYDHDPTDDVRESLIRAKAWWSEL